MSTEFKIAKIFEHSYEQVTEMIVVLCGRPKRAEELVAESLAGLATPRLKDDPERNLTQLRTRSIEALRLDWTGSPTHEQLRNSPLALVRSLPFDQAVAFVLRHFCQEDNYAVGAALNKTEAGARHCCDAATATILGRLIKPIRDLERAFARECEELALKVDPDPEILARILQNLPSEPAKAGGNRRYRGSPKRLSTAR